MPEPQEPPDDGTRFLGSGLIRSGDQGSLILALGRPLQWLVLALVRAVRYFYDSVRRLRS
jgi:hypothetical protein